MNFAEAIAIGVLAYGALLTGCRYEPPPPSAAAGACGVQPASPRPEAAWTVMLYINGDGELESAAIDTFKDVSDIGSSAAVNIVAQVDRAGQDSCCGGWTDTRRFFVTKGMSLERDPGQSIGEQDMGDKQTLAEFVCWAQTNFPARHYALVLWGHGTGFTFVTPDATARPVTPAEKPDLCTAAVPNALAGSAFKAALADHSSNGDELLNGEAVAALEGAQHIDIIGYDACVMQMIESAYAFKSKADYFVASEQLEPASSWSYAWLANLEAHADSPPEDVARSIVRAYAAKYGSCDGKGPVNRTLSAIRLSSMDALAADVDSLALALIGAVERDPKAKTTIAVARNTCEIFGDVQEGVSALHSIDLVHLADQLSTVRLSDVAEKAARVRESARGAVIDHFTDHDADRHDEAARGLAIYYPRTISLFCDDGVHDAYVPGATGPYPVAFVNEHQWSRFLLTLFGLRGRRCVSPPPPLM